MDPRRLSRPNHLAKLLWRKQFQGCHTAILGQQLFGGFRAYTRDFEEVGGQFPVASPRPMEGYCKPVGLIPDLLEQVKRRRVAVQHHGLALSSIYVENLFLLGDTG